MGKVILANVVFNASFLSMQIGIRDGLLDLILRMVEQLTLKILK